MPAYGAELRDAITGGDATQNRLYYKENPGYNQLARESGL